MSNCVSLSFSVLRAQFSSVNYLTDGYSPRIGLPFIDMNFTTKYYYKWSQLIIQQYRESRMMKIGNIANLAALKRGTRNNKAICLSLRWFSSGKQNLISSMNEITQGIRYYEQRNIQQAISYFEQSLTILPFYLKGNDGYNEEFEIVACKLAKCYAWKGQIGKIQTLTQRVIDAANKIDVKYGESVKENCDVMSILGRSERAINNQRNIAVKDNFKTILEKYKGKYDTIPLQLIKMTKNAEQNSTDLDPYIHSQLKSTIAFVLTSLLACPNFHSNPLYNKLCNTLLKSSEKASQKNVIKALILIISNLLRNGQFLQAEGMLQYSIDRKKENLKPALLKTNQQYILLQLLLACSFEGVKREQQSERLRKEYGPRLDPSVLLAQHYLLDSI